MVAVFKPLNSWIYYIAKVGEYKFYIVYFPTFSFNLLITLRQDKCIFMVYYIFISFFLLNLNIAVEHFSNVFLINLHLKTRKTVEHLLKLVTGYFVIVDQVILHCKNYSEYQAHGAVNISSFSLQISSQVSNS